MNCPEATILTSRVFLYVTTNSCDGIILFNEGETLLARVFGFQLSNIVQAADLVTLLMTTSCINIHVAALTILTEQENEALLSQKSVECSFPQPGDLQSMLDSLHSNFLCPRKKHLEQSLTFEETCLMISFLWFSSAASNFGQ